MMMLKAIRIEMFSFILLQVLDGFMSLHRSKRVIYILTFCCKSGSKYKWEGRNIETFRKLLFIGLWGFFMFLCLIGCLRNSCMLHLVWYKLKRLALSPNFTNNNFSLLYDYDPSFLVVCMFPSPCYVSAVQ